MSYDLYIFIMNLGDVIYTSLYENSLVNLNIRNKYIVSLVTYDRGG